jgi:hypothetical protein
MNAIIISSTTELNGPDSEEAPFVVDIKDGPQVYVVTVRANVPCTAANLRKRTTLALEVATELARIASREGHPYKVDPSRVADGVVAVQVAPESDPLTPEAHDIMLEITIEACHAAGLGPSTR